MLGYSIDGSDDRKPTVGIGWCGSFLASSVCSKFNKIMWMISLEWIGTGTGAIGAIFLSLARARYARWRLAGFCLFLISSGCYVVYAHIKGLVGLEVLNGVFFLINVKGVSTNSRLLLKGME